MRRIYLDRVVDENGSVSYDRLIRWAICYSPCFKDKDESFLSKWETNWKSLTKNFDVETTYVDEQRDQVCFSSNEEFVDAIRQTAKVGDARSQSSVILRCKAEVKEREPKKAKAVGTEPSSDSEVPRLQSNKKSDRQVQQVLEFLASHLADVILHLSAGADSKKAGEGDVEKEETSRQAAKLQESEEIQIEEKCSDATESEGASLQTDCIAGEEEKVQVAEEMLSKGNLQAPDHDTAQTKTADLEELAGFDREFIHARHTCDGCKKTPIIGIRYHAQSIPDYDLCSDCMASFQKTEIVFKPEQLRK